MPNQAYDALHLFQNKFQKANTIQEIQALAKSLDVKFSVEITSSTIWLLDWDISGRLSGTLEIGLKPKISIGAHEIAASSKTLRIESPDLSLAVLEMRFMEALRDLMKDLRGV